MRNETEKKIKIKKKQVERNVGGGQTVHIVFGFIGCLLAALPIAIVLCSLITKTIQKDMKDALPKTCLLEMCTVT